MEDVIAARQQDGLAVCFEVQQADGTGLADVLILLHDIAVGSFQSHNTVHFFGRQVGVCRQKSFCHEAVDVPDSVQQNNQHHQQNKDHVDDQGHEDVVLAVYVELYRRVIGVVHREELAEDVDRAEEEADLVLEGLFAAQPAKGDDDVLEPDDPENDRLEVYKVLPDVVVLPVDDGKDQQHQGDDRLNYLENVVLQHATRY